MMTMMLNAAYIKE